MITTTYASLRGQDFNPSFAKLINATLPAKTARKIAKLAKQINKHQMESDQKYAEILTQFTEPSPDESEGSVKVKAGQEEEFQKAMSEFLSTPVELELNPISMESIKTVELSALDLIKLETLITD